MVYHSSQTWITMMSCFTLIITMHINYQQPDFIIYIEYRGYNNSSYSSQYS